MSFITIPDSSMLPVMIQPSTIEHIQHQEDGSTMLTFISGSYIVTTMPREALVELLMRKEKEERSKPVNVMSLPSFVG
jgi:hypothetical protein